MKSLTRVFLGVAAVALVLTVAAPVAEAQCVPPWAFGTLGGAALGENIMTVAPGAAWNVQGAEFGRFWACAASGDLNNFVVGDPDKKMEPTGGTRCASTDPAQTATGGWWTVANTTERGVDGSIGLAGCSASNCNLTPQPDLCLVVEDWGPAGPPGVGDTAYFVGWRTEETPPAFRRWDMSKFCGAQTTSAVCSVPMEEFPVPFVTSSVKNAPDVNLVYDSNTDPAVNVYVHTPAAGPASSLIASYDLMIHTGTTDPGRDRNATGCAAPNPGGRCWNLLKTVSYADATVSGDPVTVPCDNITDDAWVAFGVTFEGGGGALDVPSQLVGRAVAIECNPNLADPHPKPRPSIRLDERPTQRAPERSRGGR